MHGVNLIIPIFVYAKKTLFSDKKEGKIVHIQ